MNVYPKIRDNIIIPDVVPNGTLFVCVSNSYGIGLKNSRTSELVSIEDCARGFWTEANLKAAQYLNCKWLAAYSKGKILGIWKIDQWFSMSEESISKLNRNDDVDSKRLYCTLKRNDEETKKVQGLVVDKKVKLGRCPNPLRGYFVD